MIAGEEHVEWPADMDESLTADLTGRLVKIRRARLLLALAEHGPGYERVEAGGALRYVTELAGADGTDRQWLSGWLDTNGMPAEVDRDAAAWSQVRRESGATANAAASRAMAAADFDKARGHLDDAFACGSLTSAEWMALHQFVLRRHAEHTPETAAAVRAAATAVQPA
ncbi:hypothetical protein [Actinoplanes sp. NBRC 101535]|uniref:hypothetical protein n=1 Tax=Actinoplanes sp. NBRC 101535 TaxID=3032196 RepID=UPI00249FB65C|nr:hypothetical protein [Actinoplanes sp. NBRC 101535]GLY08466.1 hypothetical protein Acsp01_88450 [Actinoplanes sp. NBRC 101535]